MPAAAAACTACSALMASHSRSKISRLSSFHFSFEDASSSEESCIRSSVAETCQGPNHAAQGHMHGREHASLKLSVVSHQHLRDIGSRAIHHRPAWRSGPGLFAPVRSLMHGKWGSIQCQIVRIFSPKQWTARRHRAEAGAAVPCTVRLQIFFCLCTRCYFC